MRLLDWIFGRKDPHAPHFSFPVPEASDYPVIEPEVIPRPPTKVIKKGWGL